MYKNLNRYQNGTGFIPTERDKMYVAPEYAFPFNYGSLSNDRQLEESEFSQMMSGIFGPPPSTVQEVTELIYDKALGNIELNKEVKGDNSLTRGAINILKALGKGAVSTP